MSPEQAKKFISKYWYYFEKLACSEFPDDKEFALAALDHALNKLQQDDWKAVRGYKGDKYRGKEFIAFLRSLVFYKLRDYSRYIGRTRQTPKWITERDAIYRQGWKLLCLQRLGRHEALRILSEYAKKLGRQEACAEEAVRLILQKEKPLPETKPVSLQQTHAENSEFQTESADLDKLEHESMTPEAVLMEMERSLLLQTIFVVLSYLRPGQTAADCEERVKMQVERLRKHLELSDEEYLLLKLVHVNGLAVTEAGRRLQLNINQVSARYRRLKERIEKALRTAGLDTDMKALLD
ncbi:MAG: hypothetical protein GY862_34445 [Gammaproteobacteria bacterium]|nr:hypothetical protein [Gammaproteobacteria bacterium]